LADETNHIAAYELLEPPTAMLQRLPRSQAAATTVATGRAALRQALAGRDPRLVVITGPCTIHDAAGALDYARKLAALAQRVQDKILLVMRVYFEKPRVTVGWAGLINDPHLSGSANVPAGLELARQILLGVNGLGVPCATEFLDATLPQYLADLVSWAAIGARTTESPTHQQMASGLSMPVGFKNAGDGSLSSALAAMSSAKWPQSFVGIDQEGRTAIIHTTGNPDGHLLLRGAAGQSNYSRADIAYTKALLDAGPGQRLILIDCGNGNSLKNFLNQPRVFGEVLNRITAGEQAILGVMLESNLVEGRQELGRSPLVHGRSITDGCLGWDATEELILTAHARLKQGSARPAGPRK